MKNPVVVPLLILALFAVVLGSNFNLTLQAQTAATTVPRLVRFSASARDLNGNPMTGVVGITFLLYSEHSGGSPLWLETQNVQADVNGRYTVLLGSTKPDGLPAELFTSEQARWVAVQISGQNEQARTLLVSAPYALKAGDAETVGGLPASAFVLATPTAVTAAAVSSSSASSAGSATQPDVTGQPNTTVTTAGGTANTIPMFSTSTDIENSILTQTGTSAINVGGTLNLPALGTATSSKGFNSEPQNFVASVFNSTSMTAVAQTFQWKAASLNNNKSTATGTLNLLYGAGTSSPAETGLKIANTGVITFAAGQTFPGITLNSSAAGGLTVPGAMTLGNTYTIGLKPCSANQILQYNGSTWNCSTPPGTGTVTSVGSGAGLTGGPITTSGTLSIANAGVTNAMLQNSKITLNPGSGLTGAGAMTLGNTYNINIDTTKIPELVTANTFTKTQTFTGSPAVSASSSTGDGGDFTATSDTTGFGTLSQSNADENYATAAAGWENGSFTETIGVWGYTASGIGFGTYSEAFGPSSEGQTNGYLEEAAIALWADTTGSGFTEFGGIGVLSTVDSGYGILSLNNSDLPNAFFENDNTFEFADALETYGGAYGGECDIDVKGNLTCSGSITPVAPVDGGSRKVALNTIGSPESWFEDVGSAQLSNGEALVNVEPVFGQTVNTGVEYHVFLTPMGDCKGLYVAQKSPTSFAVRELGGGTSSIAFDYRIVAKRKGFENLRLVDKTKQFSRHLPEKRAAGARAPRPDDFRKAQMKRMQPVSKLEKPILKK